MKRTIVLALAFVIASMPATVSAAENDDVTGLWYYQTHFAGGTAARLTLIRRASNWQAGVNGTTVTSPGRESMQFTFPGGDTLRVFLSSSQPTSAFWIRRAVSADPNYPAGSSQGYASRLQLHEARNGQWTATVAPLPDDYTLYLKIFAQPDGTLRAAFRNPQLHDHGPAMQLAVTRTGNALRFSPIPENGEKPVEGIVLEPSKRIQVTWPSLHRNVVLTPATPAQAVGFYARQWPAEKYVYHEPVTTRDGWTTARASSLGVDENALARAVQRIADIDPADQRAWLIHSMAIAYRGKLILDEYFYGHNRDDVHDMRSASKTFANVMLGAVATQGTPIPIDTKLYEAVSAFGPFGNPDPRKAKITVEQLLTHTAGFACDDNNDASPGNEDTMETQHLQPDWWKYTLDLPMAYEPGTHYAYCSANINLIGAVLAARTHRWIPELFDSSVAKPLQFAPYDWNVMPNGEGYLGGGAFVRPRDFLKIGQVYLDQGVWRGRRIVPAAWVADSLRGHAHISPQTTGLSGDAFMQSYYDTDDGLAWHMLPVKSAKQSYRAFFANGNGGQLLVLVPQFQLAVMFTAGNYGQGLWNRERDDIVGGMIIPALPANPPGVKPVGSSASARLKTTQRPQERSAQRAPVRICESSE